jgi:hypothetical protein
MMQDKHTKPSYFQANSAPKSSYCVRAWIDDTLARANLSVTGSSPKTRSTRHPDILTSLSQDNEDQLCLTRCFWAGVILQDGTNSYAIQLSAVDVAGFILNYPTHTRHRMNCFFIVVDNNTDNNASISVVIRPTGYDATAGHLKRFIPPPRSMASLPMRLTLGLWGFPSSITL